MEFGLRIDSQSLAQSNSSAGRLEVAAWRVGQILRAFVVEGTPAQAGGGQAKLQIGGLQIPVRSSTPLQTGESLRLSVQRTANEVVLRQMPPAASSSTPPQTTAVERALRSLLPVQQALDSSLRALSKLLPQLPTTTAAPARRLLNNTPTPAQLATPTGLKQALNNSGLSLEARLVGGSTPPPSDMKIAVGRLLESIPNQVPEHTALAQTRQIGESIQARIGIHQLASQPAANTTNAPLVWTIELPIAQGQDFHSLHIEIESDSPSSEHETAQENWTVRIQLPLGGSNTLEAVVTNRLNIVSAHFWSSNPSITDRISNALPELASAWESHGLTPGLLQSHHGTAPGSPSVTPTTSGLVDTRA